MEDAPIGKVNGIGQILRQIIIKIRIEVLKSTARIKTKGKQKTKLEFASLAAELILFTEREKEIFV